MWENRPENKRPDRPFWLAIIFNESELSADDVVSLRVNGGEKGPLIDGPDNVARNIIKMAQLSGQNNIPKMRYSKFWNILENLLVA